MRAPTHASAQSGFTLVEVLVVMVVIGVLAGIAVPTLLQQRRRAVETALQADLRAVAQVMETYYVDEGRYAGSIADLEAAIPPPVHLSDGNSVELVTAHTDSWRYCLVGRHRDARDLYVDSDDGGLLAAGVPCS